MEINNERLKSRDHTVRIRDRGLQFHDQLQCGHDLGQSGCQTKMVPITALDGNHSSSRRRVEAIILLQRRER